MIKNCLGCGVALQNEDENKLGYTPNLEKEYCMRCFKLKNYGKNINTNISIDNHDLLEKINTLGFFTLFLVDFLYLNDAMVNTYKLIKNPKVLVLTKKDLFPKNIIVEKYINNIRKHYDIEEKIYFISIKEDLISFFQEFYSKKKVLVAGYTSAGKSSLINKITNSKILESKEESTTLDFIEIKTGDCFVYDTPGFVDKNTFSYLDYKRCIRPNIKKVKHNEELEFYNNIIKSNVDNNMIFYFPNNLSIVKRKQKSTLLNRIDIPKNSDLVIHGLGFINIKNNCILETNININYIEVRDSLVGANHE